jgi:hypothetical protein
MNSLAGADEVGAGRKLRRSAAAGDKDGDLHVNWSGTNSIPLGMMMRATRRSSWCLLLDEGRSGAAAPWRRGDGLLGVLNFLTEPLSSRFARRRETAGGGGAGRKRARVYGKTRAGEGLKEELRDWSEVTSAAWGRWSMYHA